LGEIPAEALSVPLAQDLAKPQTSLRLKPSTEVKRLDLVLRTENDLARSRLLYRLTVLRIPWGRLEQSGGKRSTFHEVWLVEWHPEFALQIIEANGLQSEAPRLRFRGKSGGAVVRWGNDQDRPRMSFAPVADPRAHPGAKVNFRRGEHASAVCRHRGLASMASRSEEERLRRWRLVLGKESQAARGKSGMDDGLPVSLDSDDAQMDEVLEALYSWLSGQVEPRVTPARQRD